MRYYFEDLENQKRLREILESWLGTPFRHHCGVKGLGCDCVHLIARVLQEMELLPLKKSLIPDYPRDWHMHNPEERLSLGIEVNLDVDRVELSDLHNGDIVLHHFGQAASHAGFYFDKSIYHAVNGVGVVKTSCTDRLFLNHAQYAYRLKSCQ